MEASPSSSSLRLRAKAADRGTPAPLQRRFTRETFLALQRHAGNAAVTALLRQPATASPDLSAAQADASVAHMHQRFGTSSIQTMQEILGGWADGKWTASWASSFARWQRTHHIAPADGVVRAATLDLLVTEAVARGLQTQAIHLVADFFDLDTRSNTLSIRFDPTIASGPPFFVHGSWGLVRVLIGPAAMHSSATIKAVLEEALVPLPDVQASQTPQTGMRPDEASRAATENERMLRDKRSVRAIQGLLGGAPTGLFDVDTSHRIADFQAKENLSTARGDQGRVYEATFRRILDKLIAGSDEDLAIRLIIDWYRINETGVLAILFDRNQVTAHALQSAGRPGPSMVTFGPLAFGFGHESLVHTVEAACTQARLHASGTSPLRGAFLAARSRVMSQIIDAFATDPDPAMSRGFVFDARQALDAFRALDRTVRLALKEPFESLRARVVERYGAADPWDRNAHAALLADYKAVVI